MIHNIHFRRRHHEHHPPHHLRSRTRDIYAAELAIAAIILYYVIEMISMPGNMKRVCQMLIVLIAVLSVLQMAVAGTTTSLPRPLTSPPSLSR